MTLRLSSPRHRLALLGAGLVLAYAGLVHPFLVAPWREVEGEIGQLVERRARIQAQLAQGPLLAAQVQAMEQALLTRPGLLGENSEGLAVASLVRRLEAVVMAANPGGRSCAINDRSPLPAAVEGAYAQVALQVRLRCGTAELGQVLDQLEHGAPRLFVQELDIQALRGAPAPGESGQGLEAGFRLVGYMLATPEQGDGQGSRP
jgi:general secretion pathway protein M